MNDFDGSQIPPEWMNMQSNPYAQHKKFKMTWKGWLLEILLSDLSRKMLKFAGFYMMAYTFMWHFDIKFNVWESLVFGIGLGLAVD